MHEGNRLEYLLSKSGKSLSYISENAEVARQTLYNYFKLKDLPRKKLLTILEVAEIDQDDFWQPDVANDPAAKYKAMNEQIKTLEEMVKAKEVIIIQQQEIIDLLKKGNQKPKRK
jgi:hypothetical protein